MDRWWLVLEVAPNKKKLSLSLRKRGTPEKENQSQLEMLGEKFVPKNTAVSTKWAVFNLSHGARAEILELYLILNLF